MGDIIEPRGIDIRSDDALVILSRQASSSARWTENDARYLLDKINKLREAETWPNRLEGKPKTWERFCAEVLGYDAAYIQKIAEGVAILEGQGVRNPSVKQAVAAATRAEVAKASLTRKEAGALGGRGKTKAIDNIKSFNGGTNADYLTARIARDNPDILQRMKDGEFKSVRQAAKEAGIIRERMSVPVDPCNAARYIFHRYSVEEIEVFFNELRDLLTTGKGTN